MLHVGYIQRESSLIGSNCSFLACSFFLLILRTSSRDIFSREFTREFLARISYANFYKASVFAKAVQIDADGHIHADIYSQSDSRYGSFTFILRLLTRRKREKTGICLCILTISNLAFVQISLSLRARIISRLWILYRFFLPVW